MKDKFVIKGLNGKKTLKGEFSVMGAKNVILPAMAMSFLFKDKLIIENAPPMDDVRSISKILQKIGMEVETGRRKIKINSKKVKSFEIDEEIGKKIRGTIILSGPILARKKKVKLPFPGGCVIGKRPVDIFLSAYEKMGAKVSYSREFFTITTKKLKGAEIFLKLPSVTATETLMMTAVLAEGKTILKNCATEPEIESLAEFLNSCGAKIKGAGTPTIEIKGRAGKLLKSGSKKYKAIPDRIEAGSIVILGALAGENVLVKKCNPYHLDSLLFSLKEAGVNFEIGKNFIRVFNNQTSKFEAVDIKTHEYPGFPTDLQPQIAVFMSQCKGQSSLFETVFENRLGYLEDLKKMGAVVKVWDSNRATINGSIRLKGKVLPSPDLRAGFAFIIAGIIARGESVIENIDFIDRGYYDIENRLKEIGVDIKRISNF